MLRPDHLFLLALLRELTALIREVRRFLEALWPYLL